jgi:hypothetical protein
MTGLEHEDEYDMNRCEAGAAFDNKRGADDSLEEAGAYKRAACESAAIL